LSNSISANGNIVLSIEDKEYKKSAIEANLKNIFEIMGFDSLDQNLKDTPRRISKMWIDEIFSGCFDAEPQITVFENEKDYDEMVVLGPINLISTCSHHFQPFSGECYIGYIPDKKIVGLSKLARITHWFMKRPQIQEELTSQIANYIQKKLNPKGVGVVIRAKHYCMVGRGVRENNSIMTTSKLIGVFREKQEARNEFLSFVNKGI
jgi:GTP cyclohydrolase IA